ncbi:S41 family peptidase [Mucilaginibacter sp. HMF5004]|uniref:S41 family peptidase n=1 Tax=Mucilaginibacter rivuli TaxID=2857527 RepID=UPI001C605A4C|nr:S41 family peptidase [Mucilaginibacter rivuli]MBW4891769.1 S41 family peptidase [Mucilaginibacter rivuli]
MNKNIQTFLRTLMLLTIGSLMGIWSMRGSFDGPRLVFSKDDKLARVARLVREKYVDSVNADSLEGETVNHFLQNLDPHSVYLPAQKATSINETLDGGFEGIGVEYLLINDTLYVSQVVKDGPAAKAGLRCGDRIITLNNKPFAGTRLNQTRINNAFRSEQNTVVDIGVLHGNTTALKKIKVSRARIALSSVDAAYMANATTGYVKLSKFAATTDKDFKQALKALQAQGMQKLVLDLRNNGGGYLSAATAMADEFLPAGKLIMYTQGVHEPRTDYFSTDSGAYQNGKLAILINEYSASASEILAGAMQDLDRATIVGRRSFGKGLVQEQFAFKDGSAINLTIARYYTPSGRSIQKSYKNGVDEYHNELTTRMKKGELFSAKSNMDDSLFRQPSKFHTANGRKVFSGGGIMPDVFVAADILSNTRLFYELGTHQLFLAYALQKMQGSLAKYTTYETFNKNYSVSGREFNAFIIYATQTLKQIDPKEAARSANDIKLYMRATAARLKWGDEAYYKTLNADDVTLKKAMEGL